MIKSLKKSNAAYTLIEMIIAMTILALLSGVLVSIIAVNFDVMTDVSDRKKLVSRGMLAINLFNRELGMLKKTSDILIADDQQLRFTDTYGNTWDYLISGTQLTRQEVGVGSAQILASPIINASTKFRYYKQDNSELASVPLSGSNRALVTLVNLSLYMDDGASGIALLAMVYPENFKVFNH